MITTRVSLLILLTWKKKTDLTLRSINIEEHHDGSSDTTGMKWHATANKKKKSLFMNYSLSADSRLSNIILPFIH